LWVQTSVVDQCCDLGGGRCRLELDLPAEFCSPRVAREAVRAAAGQWVPAEVVSGAGLCASELVTNVLLHTDCSRCHLVVSYEHGELSMAVHDDSPELPAISADRGDEHGRGLRIVASLASDWGVVREPPYGKSVWLRISV
jgi:two-component sensor histidine kinase